MIKCPVCGATLPDDAERCSYCNANLKEQPKAAGSYKPKRSVLVEHMHSLDDATLLNAVKAKLYGASGIDKNPEEAYLLCEELANRGNIEGMYQLGVMKFERGEKEMAYRLWKYAARKGHEPSKVKVAVEFGKNKPAKSSKYFDFDDEQEDLDGFEGDIDDEDNVAPNGDPINSVVIVTCGKSIGTGFVVEDGYIVTNAHVVDGHKKALCFFKKDLGKDGSLRHPHQMRVVSFHKEYDIAVLEFQDEEFDFEDLALPLSKQAFTEEKVKTIGHPLGLLFSVSKGIVSNPKQFVNEDREYYSKVNQLIQTDISINFGNSGGPLLNMNGQVIGIMTCRPSESNGGIGLAVPASYIEKILEEVE